MTAAATNTIQESSQIEMEVRPSTVGDSVLMVLNMLVSTRNKVTSNPILPGTTEGEMRKLTQDTWESSFIVHTVNNSDSPSQTDQRESDSSTHILPCVSETGNTKGVNLKTLSFDFCVPHVFIPLNMPIIMLGNHNHTMICWIKSKILKQFFWPLS